MGVGDFRVTLLGTGTPIPVPDRFGPSTLVEAGDQPARLEDIGSTTTSTISPTEVFAAARRAGSRMMKKRLQR